MMVAGRPYRYMFDAGSGDVDAAVGFGKQMLLGVGARISLLGTQNTTYTQRDGGHFKKGSAFRIGSLSLNKNAANSGIILRRTT